MPNIRIILVVNPKKSPSAEDPSERLERVIVLQKPINTLQRKKFNVTTC